MLKSCNNFHINLNGRKHIFRSIVTKRVSALVLVLDLLALSSAIKKIDVTAANFRNARRFDVAEVLSDLHFKKVAEMEGLIKGIHSEATGSSINAATQMGLKLET